jgi:hypothetical protein
MARDRGTERERERKEERETEKGRGRTPNGAGQAVLEMIE